jgi:hypothetical protein
VIAATMLPSTSNSFCIRHLSRLLLGRWSNQQPSENLKNTMNALIDCIGIDHVISTIQSIISSFGEFSSAGLLAVCLPATPGSLLNGYVYSRLDPLLIICEDRLKALITTSLNDAIDHDETGQIAGYLLSRFSYRS